MHIDAYMMPRAPRLQQGARKDACRQPNFTYTGDQFIFNSPPPRATPPQLAPAPCGFWAWLNWLFA